MQIVGLNINNIKTKIIKNLVPSKPIRIGEREIRFCREIFIFRTHGKIWQRQPTCELLRRINLGWAAYGKLRSIIKEYVPIMLKNKAFIMCVLRILNFDTHKNVSEKTLYHLA